MTKCAHCGRRIIKEPSGWYYEGDYRYNGYSCDAFPIKGYSGGRPHSPISIEERIKKILEAVK